MLSKDLVKQGDNVEKNTAICYLSDENGINQAGTKSRCRCKNYFNSRKFVGGRSGVGIGLKCLVV